MAFVVSSGSLVNIERAAPPPVYSMRIGSGNLTTDYATLWRVQPELRTVVDFLARNIAQLGLHVFRRIDENDRQRLNDHPLAVILDRPNPTTTRFRAVNALVHDLCIFDSAYWLKVKADDGTRALRRVRPQRIFPTGVDWMDPDGYEIIGTKGTLKVGPDDVVHFRGYNPNDDRLGTPPIESLRQLLSEEYAANIYRQQLWANSARMSGYIKRPLDAPEWGTKGKTKFRDEWQSQYAGNDSPAAGSTPILEDGMEFVPAGTSPRDAQYVESRKLTREEVARSFHVPLPMVGILDHATFSNIREQHKQLYQDCLGPWLEQIQQEIELQLLPDMPDNANLYVEFNINEKLRGSFEEQAIQIQTAVGGPWMTRNEARARFNLPQVDGGDEMIVPLNVAVGPAAEDSTADTGGQTVDSGATAGRTAIGAKASPAAEYAATVVLQRFFARQGQAVASAIGAAPFGGPRKSVAEVFDTDRWDNELAAELFLVDRALTGARTAPTFDYTDAARAINAMTAGLIGTALKTSDPLTAVGRLFTDIAAQAVNVVRTDVVGRSLAA